VFRRSDCRQSEARSSRRAEVSVGIVGSGGSDRSMAGRFLIVLCGLLSSLVQGQHSPTAAGGSNGGQRPCYDRHGRPQRCFPPFVNAAFNLPVEATNTCGLDGPEDYCQQTGISGATKSCDVCDQRDPSKAHPASYLTDFHSLEALSWWQSGTMLSDVQWPHSVNLTLNLGQSHFSHTSFTRSSKHRAIIQQTSSKRIQNTRARAARRVF